jgi:2-polyprenyl-6-methoxyphenol hydroxylase-like FAD-dependent oxidoreductase
MTRSDVLIIGAGPTGLVLALWLAKQGVRPSIIDRTAEPGTTSRALAVQARTLELYRQLDLTENVLAHGHRTPAVNLWVKGEKAARIPFEQVGSGLTPYPFLLIFPQDEHEKLLLGRLRDFGVEVERNTELLGFMDLKDRVVARVRRPDGTEEDRETAWIAGCDGARSVVRETIGTGFPGGTYRQLFYVADVEAEGPSLDGELHIDLETSDFLGVFPLAGQGRARLIGTVQDARADHPERLTFEDVSERAIHDMKVGVRRVNWYSTYHVHHRVTEHFRRGRAFLLGDAAHIHSPAGGQGMNTGIGDAINLAWKLVAVVRGDSSEALLDSYETERIGFARRLVATTDRVFSFATASGPIADFLRTRLAPLVLPRVMGIEAVREYLFRTVGQVMLNYRDGPLSEGVAGRVRGGDRLPWTDENDASLAETGWRVHVYGEATGALTQWCERNSVPLHVFAWRNELETAGLARDAAYLLRPDGYVARADASASVESLDRYARDHQITLGRPVSGPDAGSAGR